MIMFLHMFTYILMPYNMIILCSYLPYFHVLNRALFLAKDFDTLLSHRRSLAASYSIIDDMQHIVYWY